MAKGVPAQAMLTAEPKMFPVSWDQLHRDSRALAWRLLDNGHYKGVVAITRGGLVPAAIVARELEVRVIETISCSTYDGLQRTSEVKILKQADAALAAAKPMAEVSSPSAAMRRSRMPVRAAIHSSEVSTVRDNSSLVTTREGTLEPVPRIVTG